jgi:phosphatidylinositol alpha 1,6-mannosyltransferase
VDCDRFHPALRSAVLRRALAPNGEILIGYVGRLAPEKRVDLLAAATAIPGARLVIVGDGPANAALRTAMPDAVFLGARRGAQLARIYASLDLFVHTGPHETFGQTVQEALASGMPVVAPAAGGPLDLVEPGRTGYLVPPEDGPATVAAIRDLVVDAERREAFGHRARSSVEGRSWTVIGDELIGHYVAAQTGEYLTRPLGVAA